MANQVNISNTDNKVTITPQSNTSINTNTTNTPVTVTQGTTSVVTVNTPGPIGPPGNPGTNPGLSLAQIPGLIYVYLIQLQILLKLLV